MANGTAFQSEAPRGSGGFGATEKIAQVLEASGIDAPTSLYDEALEYAREGKYAAATERLRMLLCLDPDDATAALLLGKVLATIGKWQEALSYIDMASHNGALLPPGLREEIEQGLRRQVQQEEERRARVADRERTEIENLRREAKRLRSDNAALDAQVDDLQKRIRVWSSVTALVAGSASALLLATLLFGNNPAPATAIDAPASSTPTASADPAPINGGGGGAGGAATAGAAAAAPDPLTAAPVATPPAGQSPTHDFPVRYTVQGGDTMGKIAHRFYGKASLHDHIMKANNLSSPSLQVGQKIIIPEPPE